ncbi:hypothetical protein SCFA_2960003 [anaerobic digester metagenome]|uniref:Uncharacterized protein n=1 Tax=anaerobic digester metagenome TaxID=1263854 RepID=A0A485M3I4_9ZZZZ
MSNFSTNHYNLCLVYCVENLIKNNNIQNNGHLPEEDGSFGASHGGV